MMPVDNGLVVKGVANFEVVDLYADELSVVPDQTICMNNVLFLQKTDHCLPSHHKLDSI